MRYLFIFVLLLATLPSYAQHKDVPPTAAFEVTGAVKKEMKFSISDILRFRQDTLGDMVMHNQRGEQKGVARQMKGVLLKTMLDSAGITGDKPKDYNELAITLIASDGYKNVYSWNEMFNTEVGNHVYIVTEKDGEPINDMHDRILVVSMSDFNSGRRHLKGLARIQISKTK